MRIRYLALAASAILACSSRPALSGVQNWPCDHPFVFSGAAVNVVILPYRVARGIDAGPTQAGTQLAALVQQEVLLAIAKFASVGAIQLRAHPNQECTPESVLRKLVGEEGGAETTIKEGAGLVLLWGRIFETAGDLYLQSYVRFLRRGVSESVQLRIGDESFEGRPSGQAFACAPRKIAAADLRRIQDAARSRVIRAEPVETSRGTPFPLTTPYPFWVSDMRGDWLKVESREGPSGWLLAKAEAPGWSLREKMPELSFVEGVTGYLRYRIAGSSVAPGGETSAQVAGDSSVAPIHTLDSAGLALGRFRREWRTGTLADPSSAPLAQPMSIAIALQIEGLIALLRPAPTPAAIAGAEAHFEAAERLLPYSADAKNLTIVTRLFRSVQAANTGVDPRLAVEALQVALGAEPTNGMALANLQRLHHVLLAPMEKRPAGWPALLDEDRAGLRRQLEVLGSLGR